jgi:predicted dehydrogenase
MIHDLDMLLALVGGSVREVSALGLSLLSGHEDMALARLTFANGCVAHLSASRAHPAPVRQMEVWAPEGYAAADFHQRRLTLVQPAREVHGRLPALPSQEMLESSLEKCELDCNTSGPDQLTRELEEFVAAVRTGAPVRVTGEQGRDALAVACRVVESLLAHQWDGKEGPAGPLDLPAPLGRLFTAPGHGAAA